MRRIRAADDFEAIRLRLEELRREREPDDSGREDRSPGSERSGQRPSAIAGGWRLPTLPRPPSSR